jgi:predicted permease
VPKLLIPAEEETARGWKAKVKPFCNPMFGGMLLGIALGLSGLPLPAWFTGAVNAAGGCMSPVAMLLTGITVAGIDISEMLKIRSIWKATIIRLVLFPLVGLGLLFLLPFPETLEVCILCALAMPLGLNTVVIPAAYGRDTSQAAGMALVSHMLSCFTIPLMFLLLQFVI